ncbi:hypothetical protein AK812_SmicGene14430 [Symbiodinium microadriaticum]|uniref:Uncharacterized protein n=1 Tax=Symbiodinium microadriaticum TaxID=2951 RepID=A0A1Q9E5M3_SYMMI|nr:hypothetical protein AK812_SmicGene14430 [Symbiodinium microadriaticum]CAE7234262.1 RE1 [Symbiodinium microadriaticum]CAE7949916.1 RE1 [Symbiodinium sp. KB8]
MQTLVSQQMVQELSSTNQEATAQASVWSRVGEFFQKRVAEPVRGQVQRASWSETPHVGRARHEAPVAASSPKAPLIPPRVAQAMSEWANRPSLISPPAHTAAPRDADSVSSGVPREVLMEEVKRAVAQAVTQRDEEVRVLKEQNEQLRRVLAGRGGRLGDPRGLHGGEEMQGGLYLQEADARPASFEPAGTLFGEDATTSNHPGPLYGTLRQGVPEGNPPGLDERGTTGPSGHLEQSDGSRGGIAAETAKPEGRLPVPTSQVEHSSDGDNQQPLHLLVQGMRQLQQAYMGRTEGGDFKGVELPAMPDPGQDAAVEYADWLYEVEQSVGSISDKASLWFAGCMAVAHKTYLKYVDATPLQRLSLEPEIPVELKDPKWSRLERRVMTLLLGSLKKAAKEEMVTQRVTTVPNLLYSLHVMYQPGGASERASILRQLEGMSSGEGVSECISALRKWRRYLQRAEEMGVSVPDPSLLLRGVDTMTARTLEEHSEVKFRVALAKNELQLQSRPTLDNVIRYHNTILAELQQVAPSKAKGSGNADTRIKAIGGTNAMGATDATASSPTTRKPKQCKFFLTDKGCSRGSQCKFEHSFPSREERRARCWECGAKNHSKKDCPVLKAKDKPQRPGAQATGADESPSSRLAAAMETTWTPVALAAELQAATTAQASAGAQSQPSASSTLTSTSGASVQGETGSTSEVRALLQEANAMLSKMAKLNQMKVSMDVALQDLGAAVSLLDKDVQEREALWDSGASHVLKPMGQELVENCVPVKVELADGQYVTLHQNAGGSLIASPDTAPTSTILPLGRLVQELGCELFWSKKKGLRIIHPEFGLLKTYTKGPFPMIVETQALALIAQLEEQKVHLLKENTRAGLQTMMKKQMEPSFDWELESYVQSGQKASALRALLHGDSVLGNLSETQRALMAMDIDVSNKTGWKYLKALPVRRSTRKAMMSKRWAVRFGGENSSEMYKEIEDNDVIFLDFDVLNEEQGQVDGLVGWPASDDEVKIKLQPRTALQRSPQQVSFEEEDGVEEIGEHAMVWSSAMHRNIVEAIKQWKEAPGTLEVARMLHKLEGPIKDMSDAEIRKWKRHIRNGHLPYEKRCRTCVRASATGRAHRRVVAPSCYVINIDVCGPFRQKGEYQEAKGYRYALVAGYVMPKIEGFRDYPIADDELGEARDEDDHREHGPAIGGILDPDEFLEEKEEPEVILDGETEEELKRDNARFEELYKEIGDTMEYQVLHFAVPLKSRRTAVVNDAIKTLYLQLRSEGLPVVRLHSDRARELQNQRLRSWLAHRDILATTGESQHPQSNGRAESVVKALKRRTKALMFSNPEVPMTCWPYAMTYAAAQQRTLALGKKGPPATFGEVVEVRKKFWYDRRVDMEPKWTNGRYMGPSPDLRQGHLVRFDDGRYTTTSHFKAGVVIPEEVVAAAERGCDPLPKPRRLRSKSSPPEPYRADGAHGERDPTRGIAYDPVPKRRLRAKSSPPEPGLFILDASARDGRLGQYKASARDGRRTSWEELSAADRVQIVTALRLMRPLKDCEQRAESLATTFMEKGKYGMDEVEQLFRELEQVGQLFSKATGRQQEGEVASWATGVYGHGGISSLRQGVQRLPNTTRFLAKVARDTLKIPWFGTIMLTKNVLMQSHRDGHNHAEAFNAICAVTEFEGGGVWVQDDTLQDEEAVVKEVRPGKKVKGKVHSLKKGEPFMFSPLHWHATEQFTGERLVFVTYCPRTYNLSSRDYEIITDIGFQLPPQKEGTDGEPQAKGTDQVSEPDVGYFVEEGPDVVEGSGGLDPGLKEELDAFVNGNDGDAPAKTLGRLDEDHQQLLEDLQDRSELLRYVLEEEQMILDETRAAQEDIQVQVEKTQEAISNLLEDTKVKEKRAQAIVHKACLKAATVEEEVDFETLLSNLGGEDLQVVHTVPMKQVRRHLSKWKDAVGKELNTLLGGTLRPMDIQEAKRLEQQGKLCLVPSKGVAMLKPPTTRGDGFRRRFRLVLCGNHAEAEPGYGSLYAGGASVEAFPAALIMGSARKWRGASSDVSAAFLLADWPKHLRKYAVVPPRFMVDAGWVDESTVWEVCRPLYGLRESPSIWAGYRTKRLNEAVIAFRGGTIRLKPSMADPELWLAMWTSGDMQAILIAILVLYVDDIFYVSEEEIIQVLHSWIAEEGPCSPLEWAHVGPGTRYLGYEVLQRGFQFVISQSGYISDLLRTYKAEDVLPTLLPSPREWIVDPEDDKAEEFSEEELRQGARSYGAVVITMGSSPVAWRAARQPFVTLSVMEAELLEISEASVLMESVGSLIDELAGTRVKRTLRCDNAAATAMANGGPGSWRTRHLRVRSAHLIEKISRGEMSLSHIEGQNQLADLGTKMHPKVRLWQLLRLWGFEQLLPEATVALVVRVCFLAGMMTMIENVPGATAMDGEDDQEKPPISRSLNQQAAGFCVFVYLYVGGLKEDLARRLATRLTGTGAWPADVWLSWGDVHRKAIDNMICCFRVV